MARPIESVNGPVAADQLGVTLTHEHVFVDLRKYWNPPTEAARLALANAPVGIETIGGLRRNPMGTADNLIFDDVPIAVAELKAFRALGGDTLVDLTSPDIGRDVIALRMASRLSGVQIIAGCGHYIQIAHPPELADQSIEDIVEDLVGELQVGIGSTGIKAGIIGEVGTTAPIHPVEERVLRAVARAHLRTDAPVAVHLSPPPPGVWWQGHEVLDILEEEGVPLNRVLLSHLDNVLGAGEVFDKAIEYHRDLGRRGCYLGYDGCGKEHYFPSGSKAAFPSFWCVSDQIRALAAAKLVEAGLGEKLLLSHDVCFKIELQRFGGFGYGHILRTFGDNLSDFGIDHATFGRILEDNTRAFLCGS